ncbi:putative quinol monooxygenase [Celerinatantimonas sp. MCCC 1A17872]|uniref:putative quinol monooxygenase n=1 Tax=Celerinatantimonas sp. MCCC 1A17872 TaxID=3177514 RepID=UPI0038BEE2F7
MLLAPSNAIRVIALAHAKEGQSDALKQAFIQIIDKVRQEDGCLGYQFHVDQSNPNQFLMDEIWRDQAALDKHGQTDYFLSMIKAIEPLVAEPLEVRQFSPVY